MRLGTLSQEAKPWFERLSGPPSLRPIVLAEVTRFLDVYRCPGPMERGASSRAATVARYPSIGLMFNSIPAVCEVMLPLCCLHILCSHVIYGPCALELKCFPGLLQVPSSIRKSSEVCADKTPFNLRSRSSHFRIRGHLTAGLQFNSHFRRCSGTALL